MRDSAAPTAQLGFQRAQGTRAPVVLSSGPGGETRRPGWPAVCCCACWVACLSLSLWASRAPTLSPNPGATARVTTTHPRVRVPHFLHTGSKGGRREQRSSPSFSPALVILCSLKEPPLTNLRVPRVARDSQFKKGDLLTPNPVTFPLFSTPPSMEHWREGGNLKSKYSQDFWGGFCICLKQSVRI